MRLDKMQRTHQKTSSRAVLQKMLEGKMATRMGHSCRHSAPTAITVRTAATAASTSWQRRWHLATTRFGCATKSSTSWRRLAPAPGDQIQHQQQPAWRRTSVQPPCRCSPASRPGRDCSFRSRCGPHPDSLPGQPNHDARKTKQRHGRQDNDARKTKQRHDRPDHKD